jgi:cyclopropane fatty-acyl-phospholipid synthase-like methyltransferase
MGENPLWLAEWLCEIINIQPGARILDLACGKALTSVFLAEQFGAQVVACDLWIKPTENWQRIRNAELSEKIIPVQVEAHQMPFADGYFDVVVCVNAYNYFGTDENYLKYLAQFVRPGGTIGIVIPGWHNEVKHIPEHLTQPGERNGGVFYSHEMAIHDAAWWRSHLGKTPSVADIKAEKMSDGGHIWAEWENRKKEYFGWEIQGDYGQAIINDDNKNLTFLRIVANKAEE